MTDLNESLESDLAEVVKSHIRSDDLHPQEAAVTVIKMAMDFLNDLSWKPQPVRCAEVYLKNAQEWLMTGLGKPALLIDEQSILLDQFSARMRQELTANSHKGNFMNWKPEPGDLDSEIKHHLNKLWAAIGQVQGGNEDGRDLVREYAADVANYMVKAVHVFGEADPSTKRH